MRPAPIALVVATFLGACAVPTGQIPVSADAGPRAAFMSPYDASVIFADVCLTRGANFERAAEGLQGFNVTQNATTGTYYHNTDNLSVKVTDQQCSVVFGSNNSIDSTLSEIARGTRSVTQDIPKNISVTSNVGPDGVRYFRLGLPSQNQ